MKRPMWTNKLKINATPIFTKSIFQLANTIIPYLFLMAVSVIFIKKDFPFWTILLLIPIESCFFVRIFILMHDCSHESFLKSEKATTIVGHILGIFSFTSFYNWKQSHQIHHATTGNLDKRGVGDIMTMTVNEYKSLSKLKKLTYRLYRNPITLFLFGPFYVFIFRQRFPTKLNNRKEIMSIFATNILLAIIITTMHFTIGLKVYIAVQLPVFFIGGSFGIWLFYIQHQFEDAYWEHNNSWDIFSASMEGSSYYKFPKILQWFTGNIGLHNLHHLSPRIPNYNLVNSFKEIPASYKMNKFTMLYGLKSIFLILWDENSKKLIDFYQFKKL